VWVPVIYAWLYDWMMIIMMYEFCALAYPFARLYGCVCDLPPLKWSLILLMWADVRTNDSGNGDGDATAWWLWTGMGLTMEPSAEEVLLSRFIFLYKNLCCYWSILIRLGSVVPPLFLLWTWLGILCTFLSYFCTLWIFIYVWRFIKLNLPFLIGALHF